MLLNCVTFLFISTLAQLTHGGYKNFQSLQDHLKQQDVNPIVVIVKSNSHSSSEQSDVDSLPNYSPVKSNFNFLSENLREVQKPGSGHVEKPNLPEYSKNVLRAALRARCKKVDTCKRRCPRKPRKKTVKCSLQCETTYDEEDLCNKQSEENSCDTCGGQWP